ncbi:MAG: ATP synthase F1 subunit gamma [Patescibacteria group bacterium]|nr:ATP synthase F1 subunit gamma [Patescibacteria group bacterium]
MAKTRDIQRRIKSVNNIKKITKAMEMVAAAKMRRAIEAVLKTRTYANLSWETVLNIAKASLNEGKAPHPLLSKRLKVNRVGIILISSNRGLCGGFNTQLLSKVRESIRKYHLSGNDELVETEFILLGKKGDIVERLGYKVAADFPKAEVSFEVSEIVPLSKLIMDEFLSGYYDKIMVAYTDFVNAAKQVPHVKQLLPVDVSTIDHYLGVVGKNPKLTTSVEYIEEKTKKHLSDNGYKFEYTFEPNRDEVLEKMLPKLIEVQLFQALLESNASEHSARMSSMHQANDAAGDMVEELVLTYNKARQGSITAEIAEISAGANALE